MGLTPPMADISIAHTVIARKRDCQIRFDPVARSDQQARLEYLLGVIRGGFRGLIAVGSVAPDPAGHRVLNRIPALPTL
jgi:hypothetical protein